MTAIGLALSINVCFANPSAQVFVSFSMPENLLLQTIGEANQLHISVVLNGFYGNSMEKTIHKITLLSNTLPNSSPNLISNFSLQIDPTAYERFDIHQVPALVVENGQCFDVIYGNLNLHEGLAKIKEKGECQTQNNGPRL